MKIIDKLRAFNDELYFSFEFFPPKTQSGAENLYARMDRLAQLQPMFVDITWGAGGSTQELTLEIAANAQKFLGVTVLMHLSCTGLTVDQLKQALEKAKEAGIKNILALRGDPPKGCPTWEPVEGGLSYASELVELIRREYGDYFCVAVAGHPEGHQNSNGDLDSDVAHLKRKVDAGADFVITQFFYDPEVFLRFLQRCREAGITVPIIPGIMPIQNYTAFTRMTQFCRTRVPDKIWDDLQPIKDDDAAVKAYGVRLAVDMCRKLLDEGVRGLHFDTLNLEKSVKLILSELGVTDKVAARRQFPWRTSAIHNRQKEDVRPINWANRPKSYIKRTESWDEFPNGRWGDGRSPAFGELSDSHFFRFAVGSKEDRQSMWGEAPITEEEIFEVFALYIEGRIPNLPWCEVALQSETSVISKQLAKLNRSGYLTINSQPAVNGAPSDHPTFGWGGRGGRVYQKAYVEFFTSPKRLKKIIDLCKGRRSLNYYAINAQGHTYTCGMKGVTAVTWGVFPNREIIQPTVFDPNTYAVWSQEAFQLWLAMWASLYDEESRSCELIHHIHDTYFLVAIIDNDYMSDNLWSLFEEIMGADTVPEMAGYA